MNLKTAALDPSSRFYSPFLRTLMGMVRPLVGRQSPTFVFNLIVSEQGLTYFPTPGQPEFVPWSSVLRAVIQSKPVPVLEIEHVPLKRFRLSPRILAWPIANGSQEASDKLRMIESRVADRFLRAA